MPNQFTVHVGKSIDLEFEVYSDTTTTPWTVDVTTDAVAACPAGNCAVGILGGPGGRTLYIDGKTTSDFGPVNVTVTANGKTDTIQVVVLAADNPAEPGVFISDIASTEYDTPER